MLFLRATREVTLSGDQSEFFCTFTGWQLKQSKEGIELSQQTYQDSIALDSFRHFKGYTAKDDEQLNENDQGMYRKMIGILNWMSSSSKPALAHSCSYYSSFLGKASKAHGKAVFRILEKAKTEVTFLFLTYFRPKLHFFL